MVLVFVVVGYLLDLFYVYFVGLFGGELCGVSEYVNYVVVVDGDWGVVNLFLVGVEDFLLFGVYVC